MQRYGTIPQAAHIGICPASDDGEFVLYSDAMAEIEKKDKEIEDRKEIEDSLQKEIKRLDKEIAALKEENVVLRNVIRSDEEQIKNFIKRNAEMRDDCIETARQRDLITQEKDKEIEKRGKQIVELEERLVVTETSAAKEIAKLKDELECYKLSPDEKTKLISSWQKRSFEFEDELSRLTAALKDDERAKRVVENHPWASDWSVRRQAINDFRFDIMKEAGI